MLKACHQLMRYVIIQLLYSSLYYLDAHSPQELLLRTVAENNLKQSELRARGALFKNRKESLPNELLKDSVITS